VLPVTRVAPALAAVALLALAGGADGRPLGGGERAFVALEGERLVVAVDLAAGAHRVVARLRVPLAPHNLAVSPDGRLVLVTSPPAGRVTLIDAYRPRVIAVLSGFAYPHDVKVAPGGRHAYVTEERGARIAVVDLRARRVVARIPVAPRPHDLAPSPDGREVWVTHGPRQRQLTVLDTRRPASPRVAAVVRTAGAPHDLLFAGRRVWVTDWHAGTVTVYSAHTRRPLFRVAAGRLPHHLALEPSGRALWITDHAGGRAIRFALGGRRLRSIPVGGDPHHVAIGPLRGHVVVASHREGTLAVLDPARGRLDRVRVGRGPHGVGIAPVP
jgi:DNA-binding beta-propeller fold protein YncE